MKELEKGRDTVAAGFVVYQTILQCSCVSNIIVYQPPKFSLDKLPSTIASSPWDRSVTGT